MRTVFKNTIAWGFSVLIGTGLAIFFSTQNVIGRIQDMGADVGFGDRLSMTGYDILNMGGIYGAFIAIAFLIAFLAGGLLYRFTRFGRPLIYTVAGATAMTVMLMLMRQMFFGVDAIAGARDVSGKAMQMLAGAIGGYIFHRLTRKRFEA